MRLEKGKLIKRMCLVTLGVILFIGGLVACTKIVTDEIGKEINTISTEDLVDNQDVYAPKVSNIQRDYEKIEYGMTLDEVESILGIASSDTKYIMNDKSYEILTFYSDNDSVEYIRITLVDGSVYSTDIKK
ncbi:hypothetical protein EXIGUO8H_150004 [Exiguobacterium sp. 8H]|uniref:hypothetical protein n=1 Tax=unclassified Exiguobacterium TaxID=2644629 RepID=UPI0012F42491|nr:MULTISPECIES: hypothetical protein [unclassified Exiguobacterium]VXB38825.1 hypothetical protein EXIGUO8H_150004 [Exiguobacterium sp. 8H]VXC00101.1 hypothetical protein EXIGUO8A_590016 [Exiguobacterium sp. 8A]